MKHGMSHTSTYRSWKSMIQRSCNSRGPRFSEWGGRGIHLDPRWKKFESFYVDMGDRPIGTSLERRDNQCGYDKGNCCWATPKEQVLNRSNTIWIGEGKNRRCLKDVCRSRELNYQTVFMRIVRGMTVHEALATPIKRRK